MSPGSKYTPVPCHGFIPGRVLARPHLRRNKQYRLGRLPAIQQGPRNVRKCNKIRGRRVGLTADPDNRWDLRVRLASRLGEVLLGDCERGFVLLALAVAAGAKSLEVLRRPGTYDRLEALGKRLADGLAEKAKQGGVPITVNRVGSMLTAFFNPGPVTDYASAKKSDSALFARFFASLLSRGVYFPPSQFEALFVSTAQTDEEIDRAVRLAGESFQEIREGK